MTDGTTPRGMRKGLTRYGDEGFSLFLRKAFIKAMGFSDDALDRPIVGIADTGSDYNACHANVPRLVEAVKRGVMLAGGLPMAFPTISLHESFSHPTSMFLRNLMAMDTEEMVRAQPMDAVVLIGGCDKTIPAQLMAAASADVPALVLPTGPMMTGHWRGERLGACTDCRRFWGMYRAGELDDAEIEDLNDRLAPTAGTCMVMGTASTMACMTEALGMMLPGGATIPAVHADRERFAERTGRRAVEIAAEDLRPERIMTPDAFHNALVTLQAIGGSTNALVHIAAVAGRLGIEIDRRSDPARRRRTAPRPAGAGGGDRGAAGAMVAAPGPPGVGTRLPAPLPRYRHRSRPRLRLRLHGPSRRFCPAHSLRPAGSERLIRRSDSDPVEGARRHLLLRLVVERIERCRDVLGVAQVALSGGPDEPFGQSVHGLAHRAGNRCEGIRVSSQRHGVPDGVLKARGLERADERGRHRALAGDIEPVGWPDGFETPLKVVTVALRDFPSQHIGSCSAQGEVSASRFSDGWCPAIVVLGLLHQKRLADCRNGGHCNSHRDRAFRAAESSHSGKFVAGRDGA